MAAAPMRRTRVSLRNIVLGAAALFLTQLLPDASVYAKSRRFVVPPDWELDEEPPQWTDEPSEVDDDDVAAPARPARRTLAADSKRVIRGGEVNCLATAIYFEARGESLKGQRAVAAVVLARTQVPVRPKTICGVIFEGAERRTGCQFSFACDGKTDIAPHDEAWGRAKQIARNAVRKQARLKRIVKGATFYHADYVRPHWAKRMVKVARIGTHIFYRPRRGRWL